MEIDLFIPCFVDQIYPTVGINSWKLLENLGFKVNYNQEQTCCGQPAFNAGFWEESKEVAEKNIKELSGKRIVVSPSGSCVGMMRNFYGKMFHNSALHNECNSLQSRVMEITEFLMEHSTVRNFNATLEGKAVYHDACGALRECGIKKGPRELLSHVKGLELMEVKDAETCCGFGGTFSVKFDSISTAMAEQKVENALEMGAKYIISTDASCLMHLQGYIDKRQLPIQTMHIVDILASGIEKKSSTSNPIS